MGKGGRESAAEGAKQTVAELSIAVRYTLKLRHDETVKLVDIGFYSDLGDLYAESGQTLQGSFSAVSKPNFASKYALESSRRNLHNALLCTVLNAQSFRQKSLKFLLIFSPNFAK